ncbi:glycosyltransferase family 2 protein [Streptomyces sp. URMC 123]|uniref:glycosyltransferase family 2 protein n=1 Tax=Streptomyces sp. URMC 123 TaxID=3423403 RepID=UPI003F1B968A
MSVHSHSAAPPPYPAAMNAPASAHAAALSPAHAPEFPRHVVTAVLVSHDGARWLPDALAGLLGQERPVQNVVAADTGSADGSAALLTDALGEDRVLRLARRSGFGTAVAEAVRAAGVLTAEDLPYLQRSSGWDPVSRTWRDDDAPELPHGDPVQWLWLLHDDCAPEPDALTELLRVADTSPSVAVVGPKLRGWYDRRQLLEVGVSIARSGRRWTGLERREQDQGQHDQVRPVLAVSSAGMLIRRDVWEELGGFDRALPLMRDDVDLCWRAQAAGHRVLVAPDAVLRHAEASARERRPIDCAGRSVANPHRVDKSGAVHTLLANSRGLALPYVLLRVVLGTVLRTLGYLIGKAPGQALDEFTGLMRVLLRPERILAARKRRGRPAVAAGELRPLFPPPGATVRATVEQVAADLGARSDAESSSGARHGSVESGPGDDDADFLEVEQFARLKRLARKPAPLLFLLLLVASLVACRALLGTGALAGGALLPAPGSADALWARYTDVWHPVGTGGAEAAPPYLAVVAALSTVLFGSTGLAITLMLVCSVPLAGLTAYFASRPLVSSRLLRAWGSVAYAFLPAATGALATGRLGTSVLAVLLPLLARTGAAASGMTRTGKAGAVGPERAAPPGWRAVWAYALLLTLATAFTPIAWPIAVVLGLAALLFRLLGARRGHPTAHALRFLAAHGTPLVVLAPWSLTLLTHPSSFLAEVGMAYESGSATAFDLLALDPGGPGTGSGVLLLGVVLAALAALLRDERQVTIRAAWIAAATALLFAVLANGPSWAGPATLVYGIALLTAALVGAEGARYRVAALNFGWRQPVAALIALCAGVAPLLAALLWMAGGADGPLARRDPVQVPAFVAEESPDQARTLVIGGSPAKVSYTLVRGSGARLGDADLLTGTGGDSRLGRIVARLVAGSGADQTSQLSGYAVRYVLVRDGAPRQMSRVLDATPGLTRLSKQDGSALWQVDRQVARAMIVPPVAPDDAGQGARTAGAATAPVLVPASPVEAHTRVPDGPEGRVLRIADKAAPGWRATLDGKPLPKKTLDGWAQGFELPAAGGRLDLTYDTPFTHTAWVWAQGLLVLVLTVLALPGRRRKVDDDLPQSFAAAGGATGPAADAAAVPAQAVAGEGRRARRLRAAAEGQQGAAGVPRPAEAEERRTAAADPYDGTGGDEAARPGGPFGAEPLPDPYAATPQGRQYGSWDAQGYAAGYDPYAAQDPSAPQDRPDQYGQPHDQQQYGGSGHRSEPYGSTGPQPTGQYGDGSYGDGSYGDERADGRYGGEQYGRSASDTAAYGEAPYGEAPYGATGQPAWDGYGDGGHGAPYTDPYGYPGGHADTGTTDAARQGRPPYSGRPDARQDAQETTYGGGEHAPRRDGSSNQ